MITPSLRTITYAMDIQMQPMQIQTIINQHQVYVFLVNKGAITWGSKKQSTIALSTTEAEYVTISEASREALWLQHLYGKLGFVQKQATMLFGDNDGSITMAKNLQFHRLTKHVELQWHWGQNLVQDDIKIVEILNKQQTF